MAWHGMAGCWCPYLIIDCLILCWFNPFTPDVHDVALLYLEAKCVNDDQFRYIPLIPICALIN